MLDVLEQIIDKRVSLELKYTKQYVFKSGLFDPIKQTIQGISLVDGLVVNNIKVYSVGGIKYTFIPPGTEILVGFIAGDPGLPYLAGIDPAAKAIVSFQGIINGIIGGPSPIIPGAITIAPNPAIP